MEWIRDTLATIYRRSTVFMWCMLIVGLIQAGPSLALSFVVMCIIISAIWGMFASVGNAVISIFRR